MRASSFLAVAVAFLISAAWAAGTGKIAGRVVDAATGQPLMGALITVLGTEHSAISDQMGEYYFINLQPGSYSVKASLIGYQPTTVVDVRCNRDLTTKVNFRLKSVPIVTEGVTVVAKKPIADKDLTATMRTIRSADLQEMPWDNVQQAVAAQTGVVRMGEELHVRGGRSDEVDYLIDGISVKDATEGYVGLLVNTNALSELSLLTGVYNAEYGQAMSGVINASIKDGREPGLNLQVNNGELFSPQSGRGFNSIQGDWGRSFWGGRTLLFSAGEVSLTDDWDPHRSIVPHQDREDYSWISKFTFLLPAQLRLSTLAAWSRSQFGRYSHEWYYLPDNFRSDLRRGSLVLLTVNQSLTRSAFYQVTLGRFINQGQFGVRDTFWDIGRHWWEDIRFFNYLDNQVYYDQDSQLVFTAGFNPYGYDRTLFYRYGNYWQYRDRSTEESFAKAELMLQSGPRHQIKAGVQLSWYEIDNFHLYSTATGKPIVDEYFRRPSVQGFYLHDKMEYEGLVVNGGLRYQRLDPKVGDADSSLWASQGNGLRPGPKSAVSPRLGLSYVVSSSTTFRFGYGRFFQMPLFQQLYQYIDKTSPQQVKGNILGNPSLNPPRTTSIEFGTVTELTPELSLDLAIYYKDVKDLISINYIPSVPEGYYQYQNIEQANSTGLELAARKHFGKHFTGSVRYCLARAVGTGSDPSQVLEQYLATVTGESLGTMERKEMPLDFDQRNKLVAELSLFNKSVVGQGVVERWLLSDFRFNLIFQYGSGLPYTPMVADKLNQETPDPNSARYPATKQLDIRLAKNIQLGPLRAGLTLEIFNLFDWDNGNSSFVREIGPYDAYANDWQPLPPRVDYLSDSPYYDREGDANGDGVFTVSEQYDRWSFFKNLHDRNPALTGAPRLLRAGLTVNW
jgi:outer membrane receptor protein involved in Fe transport